MENGKWTREKIREGTDPAEFWMALNSARQSGHPTTMVGYGIGRCLTLLGFWALLESEEFHLNREATVAQKTSKSHAQQIRSLRPTKGLLISNGPPTAVICYHKDRWKLTCVDIQNYSDKSESEIAAMVDCPYRDWPATDEPLLHWGLVAEQRARATCEAFVRLVTWQNQQELGMFSLTITSLAMAAFRHRFMRDRIALPEDQDVRDWERAGYHNGRIEALWCGKVEDGEYIASDRARKGDTLFDAHPIGPYHVVDARSFYAAVETFEELPVECIESHIGDCVPQPSTDEDFTTIMASVTIESDTDTYPVRAGAGTIYATGTYQTTLAGPELARAVRAGHVAVFHSWQRYRLAQCLRWYAEGMWAERIRARDRGDMWLEGVCKALMARIHGKFLQRSHRWTLVPGRDAPGPWEHWSSIDVATGDYREWRSIGWDVQIRDDAGDSSHCFPALAAWVTSHGREWLRIWMAKAGHRQVLYVGCDGMIVTEVGKRNLEATGMIWPDGVGSLRVVRSAEDVEIRGPNNYTHAGREVVSGRPIRGLRIIDNKWRGERWQGLEETFYTADKTAVSSFTQSGLVSRYTAPGIVGPGGWIDPPRLTLETQTCQMTRPQQTM
jgi:hypothetical protein